jgi:hypothetical protein
VEVVLVAKTARIANVKIAPAVDAKNNFYLQKNVNE